MVSFRSLAVFYLEQYMTVAELKRILEGLPDNMEVVIKREGDYCYPTTFDEPDTNVYYVEDCIDKKLVIS